MFHFNKIQKKKITEENPLWLNVILRDIKKENVLQSEPSSPTPFYRVVCTCRVYNTVLWWFSWWYLYFCIHFGDPVISGFYKPRLFLKLALPLDSFLLLYFFYFFFYCFNMLWPVGFLQSPGGLVFSGCFLSSLVHEKLCWVSIFIFTAALMHFSGYRYTQINTYVQTSFTSAVVDGISVSSCALGLYKFSAGFTKLNLRAF